jgi:hypothetical protein
MTELIDNMLSVKLYSTLLATAIACKRGPVTKLTDIKGVCWEEKVFGEGDIPSDTLISRLQNLERVHNMVRATKPTLYDTRENHYTVTARGKYFISKQQSKEKMAEVLSSLTDAEMDIIKKGFPNDFT